MDYETGLKCPRCGNTELFHADLVVAVFWGCDISPDGWDYFGSDGEVDFADSTVLECKACGYESQPCEFFEEEL